MFSYFQAPVVRAQGSCISLVNILASSVVNMITGMFLFCFKWFAGHPKMKLLSLLVLIGLVSSRNVKLNEVNLLLRC